MAILKCALGAGCTSEPDCPCAAVIQQVGGQDSLSAKLYQELTWCEISHCADVCSVTVEAGASGEGGVVVDPPGPDGAVGEQCNLVSNSGLVVDIAMVAAEPPQYAGGNVTPGTYVMTAATQYTGADGGTGFGGTLQERVIFSETNKSNVWSGEGLSPSTESRTTISTWC